MNAPRLVSRLPEHDRVAVRRFTSELARPSPPVVHDHASIALFLDGSMKFWIQGLYTLGPGDLLLVPASAPHYAVGADRSRSIGLSLCLSCMPATARDDLAAVFDAVRRGGCATRRTTPDERDHLERIFLAIERELEGDDVGRDLAVDAYLSLLTVAVLRTGEGSRPTQRLETSPIVAQALSFVHRHASSGISLREVAEHVARSPAHVASLVKDTTGETVVGWITRARMTECRQLLLHTDETIELIAERCGFASASHFHRAFKRAHGMTPGAWRRTHRATQPRQPITEQRLPSLN